MQSYHVVGSIVGLDVGEKFPNSMVPVAEVGLVAGLQIAFCCGDVD